MHNLLASNIKYFGASFLKNSINSCVDCISKRELEIVLDSVEPGLLLI